MKKLLGAVIAGGKARRFGRDKAAEPIDGRAMIDHVVDALRPQVDAIVICGRDWPGLERIEDRPEPDLGPLGGLNAALHHGADHGFDAVLSVPVDVLPLPPDLVARLSEGLAEGRGEERQAAVLEHQHLIGLWPVALAPQLDTHLAGDNDGSLRQWFGKAQPLRVPEPPGLRNINRIDDMPDAAKDFAPRRGAR